MPASLQSQRGRGTAFPMNGKPKTDNPADGKDVRAERLAAALRANLKRRKQQARSRAAEAQAAETPAEPRSPKD